MIQEGEISRDDSARLYAMACGVGRCSRFVRRYKDDVKSVKAGFECGIGLDGFQDIHVGDQIECFRIEQVARTE
jgi:translation initiation factor IF-2